MALEAPLTFRRARRRTDRRKPETDGKFNGQEVGENTEHGLRGVAERNIGGERSRTDADRRGEVEGPAAGRTGDGNRTGAAGDHVQDVQSGDGAVRTTAGGPESRRGIGIHAHDPHVAGNGRTGEEGTGGGTPHRARQFRRRRTGLRRMGPDLLDRRPATADEDWNAGHVPRDGGGPSS